jgi:predicted dehydrogenase
VARRKGAVLQVGHIERFNPALTAAQPYLREPKYIEGVRAGAFTFRSTDIGVVLDLMIHDIDVVLSLVAEPVEKVSALGVALLGQHEDVAHARLEFAGGCVANLSVSRVNSAARRQMQVWGPQGFVDLDFGARTASVTRPSDALLRRELDVEKIPPAERAQLKERLFEDHLRQETLAVESRNALADELQDFTECIRELRSPRVNGEQGYQALAVADRVIAAIRNHSWEGTNDGQVGPLATAPPAILRGPHWDRSVHPIRRREAG